MLKRVAVIGNCGAGKTWLSAQIARKLDLPVVHLDAHFWRPGWVQPDQDEWRAQVAELVKEDEWVLDGNYTSSLDLRLPRADLVVWLDLGRVTCEYRAVRRWWTNRGKERADRAAGCPEAIDWQFLKYVWRFRRDTAPRIEAALGDFQPLVRLRSRREVARYLQGDPGDIGWR
ncbi:topology modulation protein [Kribbella deserti]|uniref:Topology modulation protein n=1 Tax=Kribbella deserti TaxID=1926257 RepID=A0ABV6QMM7_9ACTN